MRIYLDSYYPSFTDFLNNYLQDLGHHAHILNMSADLTALCNEQSGAESGEEGLALILHAQQLNERIIENLCDLRRKNPATQTILIKDHGKLELAPERMVEMGVLGVLHKPFALSELDYLLYRIQQPEKKDKAPQ